MPGSRINRAPVFFNNNMFCKPIVVFRSFHQLRAARFGYLRVSARNIQRLVDLTYWLLLLRSIGHEIVFITALVLG